MIFDKKLLFCHEQDLVASGQVGDILDLKSGDLDLEIGEQAFIGIMVTEALLHNADNGVVFTIECDTVEGLASNNIDLFVTRAYLKAEMIIGFKIKIPIPEGCLQFIRIKSVVDTPTAGKITSGFVA